MRGRGLWRHSPRVSHASLGLDLSRPQDGIARREIRLELPDGLSFVERIGYRYCSDKTLRASAAAVYWRMLAPSTASGYGWPIDSSAVPLPDPTSLRPMAIGRRAELAEVETPIFPHYSLLEGDDRFSRLPAATARAFRPLHRDSCEFPSPAQLFEQLGVSHWFGALRARQCLITRNAIVSTRSP